MKDISAPLYQQKEKEFSYSPLRAMGAIFYWELRLTLPRFWTQVMFLFMWFGAIVFLFLSLVDYLIETMNFINIKDFMNWQGRGILFFVATLGAGLIAGDREGRSWILYFSRPIRIPHYLSAKLAVLGFYFFALIFAPTASMICLEYLLEKEKLLFSWGHVLFAVFCCFSYTLVMVFTLGIITLAISTFAKTRREACVIWIFCYFFSEMVYQFLTLGLSRYHTLTVWLQLLSLRRSIEVLGAWIFYPGYPDYAKAPLLAWYWPALTLGALSLFLWFWMIKRIQIELT